MNNNLYNMDKYIVKIKQIIKDNIINKKPMLKIYLEGREYLGKSSIVKILADSYPKCDFLKIDLKDYTSSIDINKLIGTQQGYVGYNDKHIFNNIKSNNFTIVLFDNYNFAHDNIKQMIKDILKDKYIIDNKGEKINFNNTYIFITDDKKNNNNVGFNNKSNSDYNELYDLVDYTINFDNLDKKTLLKYLKENNVNNIEEIIEKSNFEEYNYKNIEKLIKEERILIKN